MDEYISRKDALAAMSKIGITRNMMASKVVAALPASDVAPVVHGEWMRHSNELWCYCSVCWEDALMSRSTGAEVLSETCPNCGAKMDGGTKP